MPIAATERVTPTRYSEYVNPQWVRLLRLLQMDAPYRECAGSELHAADGRRVLDFLSGYCVHNLGHNHPTVVAALRDELERCGPAMLQSHVPDLAGELAEALCREAGAEFQKVFFASSGSEGVEAAIKFARATTKRTGLIACKGAFHGLTCGALSLMDGEFWRDGFGPLLPGVEHIPFNDLVALEELLRTRSFAAFLVEPIQSEAGVHVPARDYLREASALCRRYGTLFVLDEVQTGLHRTGPFLAAHRYGVPSDMVILAKALSGGLVPVSAVLMTERVYESVYGSLRRAIVHTSTFSENGLAMRAGLATLEVLRRERLGEQCEAKGRWLNRALGDALQHFEMVKEVRGEGLLLGVEFTTPRRMGLRVPFEAFQRIHPAMFGQIVVMRMFRDHGILTQICGNNFSVLKVAPALVTSEEQLARFAAALRDVMDLAHASGAFWSEALGIAKRASNI
jgi:ornithine--oxo-acid transaminase